jgi:hypothetical protein
MKELKKNNSESEIKITAGINIPHPTLGLTCPFQIKSKNKPGNKINIGHRSDHKMSPGKKFPTSQRTPKPININAIKFPALLFFMV